jgi:membrane-associated phospholipid phosphatase
MRWHWIAVAYYSYLLGVALAQPRFHRARWPAMAAALVWWTVLAGPWSAGWGTAVQVVLPLPVLLGGYWLSGLFFVRPMETLERRLLDVDDRALRRTGLLTAYQSAPAIVRESFEGAYLLVYIVVPAGAAALVVGGHAAAVPEFWAVVLTAEFLSYGMLPWLQTRSPREIEDSTTAPAGPLRRFNLRVLSRGSIQVNTLPSGHAAGAVAVALAVASHMPATGLVFLFLAAGIVAATVVGRYHYLVDTVLGVLVAILTWWVYGTP